MFWSIALLTGDTGEKGERGEAGIGKRGSQGPPGPPGTENWVLMYILRCKSKKPKCLDHFFLFRCTQKV